MALGGVVEAVEPATFRPIETENLTDVFQRQTMDGRAVRATALASADFDEDGVADLVSAYAVEDVGLLTLHRGNIDAIYAGRWPAGAPFAPEARVFELPARPDLLAAGDFDCDGHRDVGNAAKASACAALYARSNRLSRFNVSFSASCSRRRPERSTPSTSAREGGSALSWPIRTRFSRLDRFIRQRPDQDNDLSLQYPSQERIPVAQSP
jgi:hypothetical protein